MFVTKIRMLFQLLLIMNVSMAFTQISSPRRLDAHSIAYKHKLKARKFNWPLFQTFVENRFNYSEIGKNLRDYWMLSVGKYNFSDDDATRSGNKLHVFHIDQELVILLSDFTIIHRFHLSLVKRQ